MALADYNCVLLCRLGWKKACSMPPPLLILPCCNFGLCSICRLVILLIRLICILVSFKTQLAVSLYGNLDFHGLGHLDNPQSATLAYHLAHQSLQQCFSLLTNQPFQFISRLISPSEQARCKAFFKGFSWIVLREKGKALLSSSSMARSLCVVLLIFFFFFSLEFVSLYFWCLFNKFQQEEAPHIFFSKKTISSSVQKKGYNSHFQKVIF